MNRDWLHVASACRLQPDEIIWTVCRHLGITQAEIRSSRRPEWLVDARYMAISLVDDACPHLSLAAIGRIFRREGKQINRALQSWPMRKSRRYELARKERAIRRELGLIRDDNRAEAA